MTNGITYIQGDIMQSKCQTLVNPVNCVGVMGKGLAMRFKELYPMMFEKYKVYCDKMLLRPGMLWIYTANAARKILCFPTKDDWRNPSRQDWIEDGLRKFRATYREKGVTSIAFPLLGAGCGGLYEETSREILEAYLHSLDIPVEIYVNTIPLNSKINEKVAYFKDHGFDVESSTRL